MGDLADLRTLPDLDLRQLRCRYGVCRYADQAGVELLVAKRPIRGFNQSMAIDRRSFIQSLGSTAFAATFPDSIAKALSIRPNKHYCSILDVEHIVILMQENRSFDHYFGTLTGVRGF